MAGLAWAGLRGGSDRRALGCEQPRDGRVHRGHDLCPDGLTRALRDSDARHARRVRSYCIFPFID